MTASDGIKIRAARFEEIVDLRWTILRAGLPRETALFDGDDEPTTYHIGAFDGDTLLACATFMRRPFDQKPAWQLRGMAVSGERQRRGLGRAILESAERSLREEAYSNLLWCNARVPAAGFYERHGWRIVSEPFEVPTAGPHVKMLKEISGIVR